MNRSCFRLDLISLTAVTALLLGVSSYSIAQEATSTLSGRVVDVEGNPVAGFMLAVEPFESVGGVEQQESIPSLESQTDNAGHFSIPNIRPGSVQLVGHTPDYAVQSIKTGIMTVYQHNLPPFGGITFAIKQGTHIEEVEVRVKPRMRMRGRIVFADGTPLTNARVGIKVRHRSLDGTGSGTASTSTRTDDAGYLVQYMDTPGLHTVTVNYRGLSATAEPFMLQEGERKGDVLFTLDGEPTATDSPPGRVEVSAEASTTPSAGAGVWIVNPANGHAYKTIHCKSWDDANSQAIAEGAHLVAINDEAEQQWLLEIFGYRPYWIGLTDFAKESEWGWTNGEPTTYTNWAPHEPMDDDRGEEDYVVMLGQWSDVGTESVEWQLTRRAIIEKDNPPTKLPTEKK